MEAAALTPARLLECHLCDLSFETTEERRQHAKSEWYVYRIRCRVAKPGITIPPPDRDPKPSARRLGHGWESRPKPPQADEESHDGESENDASSDEHVVEFIAEDCLFCNRTSKNFNENLSHMQKAHGLVIPFQSSTAVDLQTLISFLCTVVFSYRECICCGKRRRTVEAVQHHMTSMGHCRFDVTEEMSTFYHVDSLGQQTAEDCSHPDNHTLRLPSGKLLGHRSHVNSTLRSRMQEKSPPGLSALPASTQRDTGPPQTLAKRDQKEQALATQFSRLRAGDQMRLMHLPEVQQRSLLAADKKALDGAKRAEWRTRGRVGNVGNKTAIHTKYYKQEVPVYMGG